MRWVALRHTGESLNKSSKRIILFLAKSHITGVQERPDAGFCNENHTEGDISAWYPATLSYHGLPALRLLGSS